MKSRKNRKKEWIDISVSIKNEMPVWPGDPKVEIRQLFSISKGDTCNLSTISMSLHSGTHIDAPLHFINNSTGFESLTFESLIGIAKIIEIFDQESIKVHELKGKKIRMGDRVLFKTRNSKRDIYNKPFSPNYIYMSVEAAEYLAEKRVKTVGIDYLSIGASDESGDKVHEILLKSGIWIIEGLNLYRVKQGKYHLICLPIRIESVEGTPARVIIRSCHLRERVSHVI